MVCEEKTGSQFDDDDRGKGGKPKRANLRRQGEVLHLIVREVKVRVLARGVRVVELVEDVDNRAKLGKGLVVLEFLLRRVDEEIHLGCIEIGSVPFDKQVERRRSKSGRHTDQSRSALFLSFEEVEVERISLGRK